jgi:hypothetical protein
MKITTLDSELWVKRMYIPNESRETWEKYYDIQSKRENSLQTLEKYYDIQSKTENYLQTFYNLIKWVLNFELHFSMKFGIIYILFEIYIYLYVHIYNIYMNVYIYIYIYIWLLAKVSIFLIKNGARWGVIFWKAE